MVSVDLKRGVILEPNKLILPYRYIRLLVDFPADRACMVVLDSETDRGFTIQMLYAAISNSLISIYQLELGKATGDQRKMSFLRTRLRNTSFEDYRISGISFNSNLECICTDLVL